MTCEVSVLEDELDVYVPEEVADLEVRHVRRHCGAKLRWLAIAARAQEFDRVGVIDQLEGESLGRPTDRSDVIEAPFEGGVQAQDGARTALIWREIGDLEGHLEDLDDEDPWKTLKLGP